MITDRARAALVAAVLLAAPAGVVAQDGTAPAGQEPSPAASWEVAALPSVGYDSDEGFVYGAFAEIYRHRDGLAPYVWTLQPSLELSTEGRRSLTAFFDGPHLLPGGWRIDASLGLERHLATPYFGIGNDAPYEPAQEDDEGPNPNYYRFGRERVRAAATLQRPVAESIRLLAGAGVGHTEIDDTPFDEGTTLLALDPGRAVEGGWSNHVRLGLVYDSRDREVGPTRGAWSELLVQSYPRALGSDHGYSRVTGTDRRYLPLGSDRLVFANRLLLQQIVGDAPFYDLSIVQTSFKEQEGLGGAKTIRGLQKNRFIGDGMFLWNAELRWRAVDFRLIGRQFHVVLSGFVDQGRVWDEAIAVGELLSDLHRGVGGGVRLGMGSSFVVALDVGHTSETGAAFYLGLGYLF